MGKKGHKQCYGCRNWYPKEDMDTSFIMSVPFCHECMDYFEERDNYEDYLLEESLKYEEEDNE